MTGALFLVQAIRAKFNDPELSRDGFNYFLDQLMESLRAEAGQESVEGFVEWLTSAQIRQS